MGTQNILIIILAFIIGFGYLLFIRNKDLYEKESIAKLLFVAFTGGGISILTSLLLYHLVQVNYNIFDAIFKIGVIEEFSKLFAFVVIYFIFKNDLNEVVDGIIYMSAIALGFSIIEDIIYAVNSNEPYATLLIRSSTMMFGHIAFSLYLGIALFVHTKIHKNYKGLIIAFTIACLAHGLYDGFIFHKELNIFLRYLISALLLLQVKLLNVASSFSEFIPQLSESIFVETEEISFVSCSKCNTHFKAKDLKYNKIMACKCPNCTNYIFTNYSEVLNFFRPTMNQKEFFKYLPENTKTMKLDDEGQIIYNISIGNVSTELSVFSNWLKIKNHQDRIDTLDFPIIGDLFKGIGMKYLLLKK